MEQPTAQQRIATGKIRTLEELQKEIQRGGRFIVYQYTISLFFAVTLRRFSPAFLILQGEDPTPHKSKYNRISRIFGWWGIPWGIYYTLKSLAVNKRGGIDVTEDILLNIDEEALQTGMVEMKNAHLLFSKPEKYDLKAFHKTLREFRGDFQVRQIVIGLYINTEEYVEPHYVIGLRVKSDFTGCSERVQTALYKEFRKNVPFEFLDLSDETELAELLSLQGLDILKD